MCKCIGQEQLYSGGLGKRNDHPYSSPAAVAVCSVVGVGAVLGTSNIRLGIMNEGDNHITARLPISCRSLSILDLGSRIGVSCQSFFLPFDTPAVA